MEELEDKGLSLRSEEVQEVMGKMPHWILRWGLVIMGMIVIFIGLACYFFRMPEKLVVDVQITGNVLPLKVRAESNGCITSLLVCDREHVSSKDTLAIVSNGRKETFVLISGMSGIIHFVKPLLPNMEVNEDEILFCIFPDDTDATHCFGHVVQEDACKLKVDKTVNIILAKYDEKEYGSLEGVISKVSDVPDREGNFFIEIDLRNGLVTNTNKIIPMSEVLYGKAEIMIENKRILEKIIER